MIRVHLMETGLVVMSGCSHLLSQVDRAHIVRCQDDSNFRLAMTVLLCGKSREVLKNEQTVDLILRVAQESIG